MAKTQNNSTPCTCCKKLMPNKSGRRGYCSARCRKVDRPKARQVIQRLLNGATPSPRGGGPKVSAALSGHRAMVSRTEFFPAKEIRPQNPVFGQELDFRAEARNTATEAIFGLETSRAEFVPGVHPGAMPGLRVTIDLDASWGYRRG